MGWLPGDNRDLQTGKPDAPLVYYIFHCLSYKGKNCRNRALLERKKIIKKILPKGNLILKYAGHVGATINYFSQVKKMGLEGMIAKRADSSYFPGKRSLNWLKIKNDKLPERLITLRQAEERRNLQKKL